MTGIECNARLTRACYIQLSIVVMAEWSARYTVIFMIIVFDLKMPIF